MKKGMCPISLLTNPFSYFIVSYDNIKTKTNKSSDEEEYASPLIREDGRPAGREAERLSEGRNAEGSFRAGNLNGYAVRVRSKVSRVIPVTG